MGRTNFPNAADSAATWVQKTAAATLKPHEENVECVADSTSYTIKLAPPPSTKGRTIRIYVTTLNSKTVTVTDVWANASHWADIALDVEYEEVSLFSDGRRYQVVENS